MAEQDQRHLWSAGMEWALPQLWHASQLQLGADPWSGNSTYHKAAKKKKKKKEQRIYKYQDTPETSMMFF